MKKQTAFAFIFCFLFILQGYSQKMPNEYLYVGTFSQRGSKGIYVLSFDRAKNQLSQVQTYSEKDSPSFLEIHPNGRYLYAVYREGATKDDKSGSVVAFSIDRASGKITKINEQSTEGSGPCHVSVDPKGRFAYVSNYSSGNLAVYPIRKDGGLDKASDVVQHSGSSINPNRQKQAYMHSIIPAEKGNIIYASDLGIDKIMIYQVNQQGGLSPAKSPFVKSVPGAGPRHLAIHPNGNFAFSVEELSSTVASYKIDKATGTLVPVDRKNGLPENVKIDNTGADIHVSPDGKFLYASNRGHDSLVIFEINQQTGKLTLVGHEPTRGGHPRNFCMDRKGEFVFVANRDNDNVVIFKRDASTGKLSYTGAEANVPAAVCIKQLIIK